MISDSCWDLFEKPMQNATTRYVLGISIHGHVAQCQKVFCSSYNGTVWQNFVKKFGSPMSEKIGLEKV